MRQSTIRRTTKETDITLSLDLDQSGEVTIDTGIGFFDHMLTLMAFHGNFSLTIKAEGDLEVDTHHTAEDIGIALGEAFREALGDKKGIRRYADILLPMDESLARGAIDLSNRSFLVYDDLLKRENLGTFATENFREFFQAFTQNARITLHLNVLYGTNDHHKIEAVFKAFGRLIREAAALEGDGVPSTKGVL